MRTVIWLAAVGYALICLAEHLGGERAAEVNLRWSLASLARPVSERERSFFRVDVYDVTGLRWTFTAPAALRTGPADPFRLVEAGR